jgi:hypothetical protein
MVAVRRVELLGHLARTRTHRRRLLARVVEGSLLVLEHDRREGEDAKEGRRERHEHIPTVVAVAV